VNRSDNSLTLKAPLTTAKWYLRLSLGLRIVGCISLVLVGLIFCWPEWQHRLIHSLSVELTAILLVSSGLMFVRAGEELHDEVLGTDGRKRISLAGMGNCLFLAALLASPVAVSLLLQGMTAVFRG
jgi:hypothetical protein